MLPSATLRGWHMDQLRKSVHIVNSIIENCSQTDLKTLRDGGTGWTVLEVLCHLRDYEALFLERAHMTVEQTDAALYNPNPDELASARRYNEQNLSDIYAEWRKNRSDFLGFLEGQNDSAWERAAIHPKRGRMSLQDQLALTAWHDVNHLEQITRILAEKKS
jgi:uncharacterized damage-inducible protein DinB